MDENHHTDEAHGSQDSPPPAKKAPSSVPGKPVGTQGKVLICIYLALVALGLMVALVQNWPAPRPEAAKTDTQQLQGAAEAGGDQGAAPSGQEKPQPPASANDPAAAGGGSGAGKTNAQNAAKKGKETDTQEPPARELLLIVALAGGLGAVVHALRSIYKYIGHDTLRWEWAPMYFLLPFIGASMALIFILAVKSTILEVSSAKGLYGAAAISGLVGMFSEFAGAKLEEIARAIFKQPDGSKKDPHRYDKGEGEAG